MRIRVGCEMTYELGQVTPMIAILTCTVRVADLSGRTTLLRTHLCPWRGTGTASGTGATVRCPGWYDDAQNRNRGPCQRSLGLSRSRC